MSNYRYGRLLWKKLSWKRGWTTRFLWLGYEMVWFNLVGKNSSLLPIPSMGCPHDDYILGNPNRISSNLKMVGLTSVKTNPGTDVSSNHNPFICKLQTEETQNLKNWINILSPKINKIHRNDMKQTLDDE